MTEIATSAAALAKAREDIALALLDEFPDVSADERQAFIGYCVREAISKKKIRRALLEGFLSSHRRQVQSQLRAERFDALTKANPDLLKSLGINLQNGAFPMTARRAVDITGIALTLHCDVIWRPEDHDLPEAITNAEGVLHTIKSDLEQKAKRQLDHAETALRSLADSLLSASVAPWLGGTEAVRQRYLTFPEPCNASDAEALINQRRSAALQEAANAKHQALSQYLRSGKLGRLSGRTIQRLVTETFCFRERTFSSELLLEKTLSNEDINRLAELSRSEETPAGLETALDKILMPIRTSLKTRIDEQLRRLETRANELPHIELLADEALVATVASHYAQVDHALKKRRARNALVSIEERAREAKFRNDVEKLAEHRDAYADVASYYPLARSLGRELVLYVGPTNSGKTWRALNDLAQGQSGAYLAPLRLLALEGQEELEKRGKITSFLTGEERDLKEDATFISSTIEMLNFDNQVDAVVIDEVQLMTDEKRGWAWLAAFVGAPAKRVIMTGSPDCVENVKNMAAYLGEPLTVHECQRYNELQVAEEPLRLRDLARGTAIVCFSRRDVLDLKSWVEANLPYKAAVIYGNLSPQVRREEARRFRSGEADILVSTDAIAMGLNLPIKEVVFYATEKFDGEKVRPLTPPEIRQIGGRAGRYGFASHGMVHALSRGGLKLIQSAISSPQKTLTPPFFVAPGPNHVKIISEVLGSSSLERILAFFERALEFSDPRFTRSNIDELAFLASFVDRELPHLSLRERLTIASAPVDTKSESVLGYFTEDMLPAFKDAEASREAAQERLRGFFDQAQLYAHEFAHSSEELREAEDYLKALTVYAWLAFRFPQVFSEVAACEERREAVNAFIERSLRRTMAKTCVSCGAKLPPKFTHRKCDRCFHRGRKRA